MRVWFEEDLRVESVVVEQVELGPAPGSALSCPASLLSLTMMHPANCVG